MTVTYGGILSYISDLLENNDECSQEVREAVIFCRKRIENNQEINTASDDDKCQLLYVGAPLNIHLLKNIAIIYEFDLGRNINVRASNIVAADKISYQLFKVIAETTTITTSGCFAFLARRPERDALYNEFLQSQSRYNENNEIRKEIASILSDNEIKITPYDARAGFALHKTAILSCLKTSPHLTSLFTDEKTKIGKRPTSSEQLVIGMRDYMSVGAST